MFNFTVLHGRLTKDPDVREARDTLVARFTLAVDDSYNRDKTDFISCVAFGKTAEHIERYFFKGKEALVFGKIQTGSYTKDDGSTVYTTDVIVQNIDFCGSASDSGSGGSGGSGRERKPSRQSPKQERKPTFVEVDDDEELPF